MVLNKTTQLARIGVHFRGTDKNGNEATRISRENVISNIKAFLLKTPNLLQFLWHRMKQHS